MAVIYDSDDIPAAARVMVAKAFGGLARVVSSSVANPTVITTTEPHGFTTGDQVYITGHSGSAPAVNGVRVITVTSPTTFTVPVNVTVAGSGGNAADLTVVIARLRAFLLMEVRREVIQRVRRIDGLAAEEAALAAGGTDWP